MGRPCAFDRDAAIQTAMRLFHDKGYEATSVDDLTTALSISRASLYNAFGDKHGLLLAAFDCAGTNQAKLDQNGPVRDVLRTFLEGLASQKQGCFFLTLGSELASEDQQVRTRVKRSLDATRRSFRKLIDAARERGELRSDIDAPRASAVLLGAMVSVLTLARVHRGRNVTAAVIDQAMQILS